MKKLHSQDHDTISFQNSRIQNFKSHFVQSCTSSALKVSIVSHSSNICLARRAQPTEILLQSYHITDSFV